MFVDSVQIKLSSGKGGNGIATWRREKYVAYGGPDGGDGGKGGSVYLIVDKSMNTLLDFKHRSLFKAEDGTNGARSHCTGRSGEDLYIRVPPGTVVRDLLDDKVIADLTTDAQTVLVAEGGRGGRGNARFKSNRNNAPYYCEPGEAAIERELELELKMIADVGLIGFPNAGKSTLISRISAAKPKIADYAFTTLEPNLGVVKKPSGDGFLVADIPGLIEGASQGKGLGHNFLRHIERTKLLVHLVDVWGFTASNIDKIQEFTYQDPVQNYYRINEELLRFSDLLSEKKQIIAINKIEGYPDEELSVIKTKFSAIKASDKRILEVFYISAVSGDGLEDLVSYIADEIDKVIFIQPPVLVHEDLSATDHEDSDFTIECLNTREGITWKVRCGRLERQMRVTNIREMESLRYLYRVAQGIGLFEELKRLGARLGDTLNIDGADFEVDEMVVGDNYSPDDTEDFDLLEYPISGSNDKA